MRSGWKVGLIDVGVVLQKLRGTKGAKGTFSFEGTAPKQYERGPPASRALEDLRQGSNYYRILIISRGGRPRSQRKKKPGKNPVLMKRGRWLMDVEGKR